MRRHGVPFLLSHVPHRSRHSLVCNSYKSSSDLVHRVWLLSRSRSIDLVCQVLKFGVRGFLVEWLVGIRAKDGRKLGRNQAAEDEIGVGDGEITSFTVASWTRAKDQYTNISKQGTHWAPTLSGPTTNMPFLYANLDPPPLPSATLLRHLDSRSHGLDR